MYAIEVQTVFSAAHALRLPGGALEPMHGHDFRVTVKITCQHLDALETVLDFHDVEKGLEGVVGPWRNRSLNEMEPFQSKVNPSAERIAEEIGRQMEKELVRIVGENNSRQVRLSEVRVTEATNCQAIWSI